MKDSSFCVVAGVYVGVDSEMNDDNCVVSRLCPDLNSIWLPIVKFAISETSDLLTYQWSVKKLQKWEPVLKIVSWVHFVCFLGEVMARQFCFKINWPLGTKIRIIRGIGVIVKDHLISGQYLSKHSLCTVTVVEKILFRHDHCT